MPIADRADSVPVGYATEFIAGNSYCQPLFLVPASLPIVIPLIHTRFSRRCRYSPIPVTDLGHVLAEP